MSLNFTATSNRDRIDSLIADVHILQENVQNVSLRIYREHCKKLSERCNEVFLCLRALLDGPSSADRNLLDDEVKVGRTISTIRARVQHWASFGAIKSVLHRNEIMEGLAASHKELDDCLYHLNGGLTLQIQHVTGVLDGDRTDLKGTSNTAMKSEEEVQAEAGMQKPLDSIHEATKDLSPLVDVMVSKDTSARPQGLATDHDLTTPQKLPVLDDETFARTIEDVCDATNNLTLSLATPTAGRPRTTAPVSESLTASNDVPTCVPQPASLYIDLVPIEDVYGPIPESNPNSLPIDLEEKDDLSTREPSLRASHIDLELLDDIPSVDPEPRSLLLDLVLVEDSSSSTPSAELGTRDQQLEDYLALVTAVGGGDFERVQRLLETGVNPNPPSKTTNGALHSAVTSHFIDIARLLLSAGADVNYTDVHGEFALRTAAANGDLEFVKLLLDAGADVNMCTAASGSALQAAAGPEGTSEIVRVLLDAGADVNLQGGEHGSALQATAASGDDNLSTVQMLLDSGADVNAVGGWWGSALQAAVYQGNRKIVEALLAAGADVNMRGGKYGSALQAAASQYGSALQLRTSKNYADLFHLLVKHGADRSLLEGGNDIGSLYDERRRDELIALGFRP